MTVSDLDIDFAGLLADANLNASTDWEMAFVSDIEDRFAEYGGDMFVSSKQLDILERIAGWD